MILASRRRIIGRNVSIFAVTSPLVDSSVGTGKRAPLAAGIVVNTRAAAIVGAFRRSQWPRNMITREASGGVDAGNSARGRSGRPLPAGPARRGGGRGGELPLAPRRIDCSIRPPGSLPSPLHHAPRALLSADTGRLWRYWYRTRSLAP